MSCSALRAASSSWSAAASCSRERRTKWRAMRACARSIWANMLELHDLRAGYGDAVVLDGISLALGEGASLAVLGRNGVGKSTLLLTIMGYTRLRRGDVSWRGRSILRLAPHERARLGIGWAAQEREIFPSLSVEENLTVAARAGHWDLETV